MRQRNTLAPMMLIAALITGCSQTTTQGTAHPASTSTAASAVNPTALDPGNYPTTAQPALGNAGSDHIGRIVEGQRMAGYVVGPWQADATLSVAGSDSPATIIETFEHLSHVLWTPIVGGAYNLPLVVGFSSERQTPGPAPQMMLRNAVVRFADPATATTAAQGMHDRSLHMPRDPRATPIVTAPEQTIPIPGHPEAAGSLLTFQEANQTVRELNVFTAHGPYVLIQVARCTTSPDCEIPLVAKTLDLQQPLIDTFTATPANQFAALPLDPTGLVARTLPLPPDQASSTTGAAYPPAAALHFDDDPVQTGPALSAAGVDEVAINLTTVYQAKDPAAGQTLTQTLHDIAAKTPAAQAAPPVPGLPQSHCTKVAGAGGLVPRYWCLAAASRYTIKAIARQLDKAHQQITAQYRILTG